MKRATKIILPIVLVLVIIACSVWYLFIYDRPFTRDMLLSSARYFESNGNHDTAKWFYDLAYKQDDNNDAVAIELAEQYKENGNYTKAEYTLYKAIQDGGGINLYVELCKLYVEQDKLFDAVNLLNNVTGATKSELKRLRPDAPTASPDKGTFTQLIEVTLTSDDNTIYYNANGQYPSTVNGKYTGPVKLSEGKINIYAISVNELGLVSPLQVYQYEIGNIIKPVTFADPSVESVIREQLTDIDPTAELLSNDLWTITSLVMPADATDYSDLQYLSKLENIVIEDGNADQLIHLKNLGNLKTLEIKNTFVSAEVLDVIAKMSHLERLVLHNCDLSQIAPLSALSNVTYLDLGENTIRDISPLQNLISLTELSLEKNALEDLSQLASCQNLTKLNISDNSITNLSPVYAITGLTWLDASGNVDAAGNRISDISGIDQLTSLANLYLSENALTDVSVLAKCSALIDLSIDNNKISDITALSSLQNLMYLNFASNQISVIPQWEKDCSLVTIDGSHNVITSLEPLSGLESLNNVYMDYNAELTSVEPLATCHRLMRVNVYGTKVTEVSMLTSQSIIVNYNPTQ